MLMNLGVAGAYFYFNWCYFALAATTLRRQSLSKLLVAITFVINYILFYLCSVLEINLIFNWLLFFLFLLVETMLYCKSGWRTALFFSLNGILYELAVNNFCRCVVSIAISQPLSAFDNNISSVGNLKPLPIFLGFLLGGMILHFMTSTKSVEKLRILIEHPEHLSFQLELVVGMFLYLCVNLFLYQSQGNEILLKLWGIKSSFFSVIGSYLGLRYSLKMCWLSDFREQNRIIQRELLQSESKEEELRSLAYRDTLTGTYNRQYALEYLESLLEQKTPFSLCFLDLDGLKGVNDHYGHLEGDRYLTIVAAELTYTCHQNRDLLARYGGDEFLLLFPDIGEEDVKERLCQVNCRLDEMSDSGKVPYPMSLSFGIVESQGTEKAERLISAADEKMYHSKQIKKVMYR